MLYGLIMIVFVFTLILIYVPMLMCRIVKLYRVSLICVQAPDEAVNILKFRGEMHNFKLVELM